LEFPVWFYKNNLPRKARLTFVNDCKRAVTSGVLETAETTFLLLIAVRYFDATAFQKSLIASAGSFGLFLAPLIVYLVGCSQTKAATSLKFMHLMAGLGFLISALLPYQWIFVFAPLIAISLRNSGIPLLTHIYQNSYPGHSRGKLFAVSNSIRIISAGLFSATAGYCLSGRIEYFQVLLLAFSIFAFGGGILFDECPSTRIEAREADEFFKGFRYLRLDSTFRLTLISWMFMGIGNLMMVPLRVEYLAGERYGLRLSEAEIALFVGIIPLATRLFLSPFWGWLFDKINFFALRVIVNLSFMIGILAFFSSNTFVGLAFGAFCYGVAGAGGDVAWNLWVTKFAPKDAVSDYMSVHTFFTGLRGLIAPQVSFYLITKYEIANVAWLSAALILAGSIFLFPEILNAKNKNQNAVI